MKNLKIGTKLYVVFLAMLLQIIIIAAVAMTLLSSSENTSKRLYEEYGKTQGDIGMGFSYFQEVKADLRNALYLYSDNSAKREDALATVETAKENMYKSFSDAKKGLTEEKDLELFEDALKYIDSYISDVDICVDKLNQQKVQEAREHLLNNGVESAIAAVDAVNALNEELHNDALEAKDSMISQNKTSIIFLACYLLFSFVACSICLYLLLKSIKKPIVSLTEISRKAALGEINVEIPTLDTKDEIGTLYHSFRDMIDNFKTQADVINHLANGDFRAEVKAHSANDAVGNALAKLIQDDNHTFHAIRNATNQISLGSVQIASASQTLAEGSTQQASAIEQITASISDIAEKNNSNAVEAEQVSELILKTKENVETGNQRMREMVSAMEEINSSSEDIKEIIKVIDDIAFNINILALNAAVEAARAGDQGKGFAVVAEEVRNLAERSAASSSQTSQMIEDSIQKVQRGSALAKETADSLATVSDMVEQVTQRSTAIANASREQAVATEQINQALSQVSDVVQSNSATSQQCAAASEELSGQTNSLNSELSKFKLKDVIGNMPEQTLDYTEPYMLNDDITKY